MAQHAGELRRWLQGFCRMAQALSAHEPALADYPVFERVLAHLAGAGCQGCREGGCPMPTCRVGPCVQQRGLDGCWQCAAFPCHQTGFDEGLEAVWLRANRRMAEVGVEAYWHEQKSRPHYAHPG